MIIATHKEIDKGSINLFTPFTIINRTSYTDSDIILKEGQDYEAIVDSKSLVIPINTLTENLKFIFQDAYRKGREDTLNQLMH